MVEPKPSRFPGRTLARRYHRFQFGRNEFEVEVRYTNLKPIGKGAYGLVCSADDTLTGNKVAIKRVGKVFQDLIDAKRILREIKLLRHLSGHENIMGVLDVTTGPPETQDFRHLYIITQLYECDLDRIISSSQRLTNSHAQYFLYQILRGLKYIHSANVLHRDLKPPNLLVNSNCDVAICDFGLSRGLTTGPMGALTEYVVTRWYRSPELLCECETYGPPVDVWSTGCIFGEILSRRPLFQGASSPATLDLILRLVGTPSDDDLEGFSRHAKANIKSMPKHSKKALDTVFPRVDSQALDLLGRMLDFNPATRITVEEALEHPYLAELHARACEPTCDKPFDFDYERGYPDEMPQALLQKLMYSESLALSLRGQTRAAAAEAEAAGPETNATGADSDAVGSGASSGAAAAAGKGDATGAGAGATVASPLEAPDPADVDGDEDDDDDDGITPAGQREGTATASGFSAELVVDICGERRTVGKKPMAVGKLSALQDTPFFAAGADRYHAVKKKQARAGLRASCEHFTLQLEKLPAPATPVATLGAERDSALKRAPQFDPAERFAFVLRFDPEQGSTLTRVGHGSGDSDGRAGGAHPRVGNGAGDVSGGDICAHSTATAAEAHARARTGVRLLDPGVAHVLRAGDRFALGDTAFRMEVVSVLIGRPVPRSAVRVLSVADDGYATLTAAAAAAAHNVKFPSKSESDSAAVPGVVPAAPPSPPAGTVAGSAAVPGALGLSVHRVEAASPPADEALLFMNWVRVGRALRGLGIVLAPVVANLLRGAHAELRAAPHGLRCARPGEPHASARKQCGSRPTAVSGAGAPSAAACALQCAHCAECPACRAAADLAPRSAARLRWDISDPSVWASDPGAFARLFASPSMSRPVASDIAGLDTAACITVAANAGAHPRVRRLLHHGGLYEVRVVRNKAIHGSRMEVADADASAFVSLCARAVQFIAGDASASGGAAADAGYDCTPLTSDAVKAVQAELAALHTATSLSEIGGSPSGEEVTSIGAALEALHYVPEALGKLSDGVEKVHEAMGDMRSDFAALTQEFVQVKAMLTQQHSSASDSADGT